MLVATGLMVNAVRMVFSHEVLSNPNGSLKLKLRGQTSIGNETVDNCAFHFSHQNCLRFFFRVRLKFASTHTQLPETQKKKMKLRKTFSTKQLHCIIYFTVARKRQRTNSVEKPYSPQHIVEWSREILTRSSVFGSDSWHRRFATHSDQHNLINTKHVDARAT